MLFATEEALERARSDDSSPRREIRAQLRAAARDHLTVSADALLEVTAARNLFFWSNQLNELGLAFALDGDEEYLAHALTLVAALSDGGWRAAGFDGHIHVPWVMCALAGFDDLHGDRLDDQWRERLRTTLADMTSFVWQDIRRQPWGKLSRTQWNHNVIGYTSLGVAGLVLRDHPASAEWIAAGLRRTRRFVEVGVTHAGMTWEGLNYCGMVFKHLSMLMAAVAQLGWGERHIPVGSDLEQRLARIPSWYAHSVFPQGCYLQNYNDSHWDPHGALWGFLLGFGRLRPELCAAVWDRLIGGSGSRTFGRHPVRSSLAEALLFFPPVAVDLGEFDRIDEVFHCPDSGYVSVHDRLGAAASVFTFSSGPFPGYVHAQADNNAFTFIAAGDPIVLDAGSANLATEDSGSSSRGHSAVLVDGRGEHVAGEGQGVSGTIETLSCTGEAVVVSGDATLSYGLNGYNPVRWARRSALFVLRPVPYLVTCDDIDKDGAVHRYDHLLHLPRGSSATHTGGRVRVLVGSDGEDGTTERGTGLVHVLWPRSITTDVTEVRASSDPWDPHEVRRFVTDAVNPYFVLLHLAAGGSQPVTVEVQPPRRVGPLRVTVTWPDHVDVLTFPVTNHRRWTRGRPPGPPSFERIGVPRDTLGTV